jgi:hypothetical protein
MHNVVLDPRDAADSLLGDSQLWCDEDFDSEEDEAEETKAEEIQAGEIQAAEDQQVNAPRFARNDDGADIVSSAHVRKTPAGRVRGEWRTCRLHRAQAKLSARAWVHRVQKTAKQVWC